MENFIIPLVIVVFALVVCAIVYFLWKKQAKQEEAIVNLVSENFTIEELEAAAEFLNKNRKLFQKMIATAPFYFDKDRLPGLLVGLINLTISEKK